MAENLLDLLDARREYCIRDGKQGVSVHHLAAAEIRQLTEELAASQREREQLQASLVELQADRDSWKRLAELANDGRYRLRARVDAAEKLVGELEATAKQLVELGAVVSSAAYMKCADHLRNVIASPPAAPSSSSADRPKDIPVQAEGEGL